MNNVNKTLYIPLYGKALVSRKGLFLHDQKAEEIWAKEAFPLKGKSRSRWLAYYLGIRSAVFDQWAAQQMKAHPDAVVLHLGCGMDSRVLRVRDENHSWFDVDFPDVIAERKKYFTETAAYRMVPGDVKEETWLESIPSSGCAIVIMEGISMYLNDEEKKGLLNRLCNHFDHLVLLMDCYTTLAARLSRYKNPINVVGVTKVYGTDDPRTLENSSFTFVKEHDMTPSIFTHQLQGMERMIFRKLYVGKIAKKMYRLFEYKSKHP